MVAQATIFIHLNKRKLAVQTHMDRISIGLAGCKELSTSTERKVDIPAERKGLISKLEVYMLSIAGTSLGSKLPMYLVGLQSLD